MEREPHNDLRYMEIKWRCTVHGHISDGEWYFVIKDDEDRYWDGERWIQDDEYGTASSGAARTGRDRVIAEFEANGEKPPYIVREEEQDALAAATARAESLDAELLRVRTTGHGAAHELDNIAIECGLGHSPKAGVVAAHVRALRERAEKAEKERDEAKALYAKAWEECEEWRKESGVYYGCWHSRERDGDDYMDWPLESADAHDAARKEAGL